MCNTGILYPRKSGNLKDFRAKQARVASSCLRKTRKNWAHYKLCTGYCWAWVPLFITKTKRQNDLVSNKAQVQYLSDYFHKMIIYREVRRNPKFQRSREDSWKIKKIWCLMLHISSLCLNAVVVFSRIPGELLCVRIKYAVL